MCNLIIFINICVLSSIVYMMCRMLGLFRSLSTVNKVVVLLIVPLIGILLILPLMRFHEIVIICII